jgi:hypothetical protein
MITSILGQITGQLDRRFILNAFFPTMLFSLLLTFVIAAQTAGIDATVSSWEDRPVPVRVLIVVAWGAGVLVGANLVANGTLWIIQLFEGYVRPLRWVSGWGRRYQLDKATSAEDDYLQVRFPVHKPASELTWKDVAPTSLGNVLKSAETYPEGRYGVQAMRVWPRLYHLLPSDLQTSLAEARASMEFLLVVAFYAFVFAFTSTIFLVYAEAPLTWSLLALVGGTVIAAVAYRGAHAPALIYGDHVRAAFDLYRLKLLKQCDVPLPATNAEERRTWAEVIRHLDRGEPPQWRYTRADTE